MKKYYGVAWLLLVVANGVLAQGVTIASGGNIFLQAGSIVSFDSLALKPTSNFNLTGVRSETRTATVTHPIGKPYIKRVYHFSATTPAFTGNILFYYRDAELAGISESALTLNIHNGTAWNAYTTGVTRNSVSNYVATDGLASVPLNELTLAENAMPLTQARAATLPETVSAITVHPNPVQDVALLQIASPGGGPLRLRLYDEKGALLYAQQQALTKGANQIRLNMRLYPRGNYMLVAAGPQGAKQIVLVKQQH